MTRLMMAVAGGVRGVSVPLVVAGLVAIAGLTLGRIYNGPLLAQLVAAAGASSVVVCLGLRRAPAWLVAPVSLLALGGYAAVAVGLSARAAGVPGDVATLLADAARNALPRLITALIPVEAQPDTVLGPVVLAWLAGLAGTELAVRHRRPAVALLPPTLLYVGALVAVGPNAGASLWSAVLFAALAAAGFAAGGPATGGFAAGGFGAGARRLPGLDPRQATVLRLRAASGLAVGLAAVLAAVAVAAPLVAGLVALQPTDPRRYVSVPSLDVLDQNPLIRISGWAANPEQHLLDVTVIRHEGGPQEMVTPPLEPGAAPEGSTAQTSAYDSRLRLAVLSDWDGVTWHLDAQYRNAGRALPPLAPPPGHGGDAGSALSPPLTIEERITVDELRGRLLPAISAPRRVEGVRVAYDRSTGSLLHGGPLVSGTTYTVTSISSTLDVVRLPASDVPSGPAVARYLAVGPEVPPDLSQLAQQIATGEGSPYLRAVALEGFLAEHYRYAPDAPSGHSYANLRFFLFADPRAGGQRGTSEQFAAAFASLGRLMGLPTRVVVGFSTPAGGGAISGADARAWPEVLFAGVGWIPFDPMPEADVAPRPLEDEYLPKPPPTTTPPPSVDPPEAATWTPPAPSGSLAAAGPGRPGPGEVAGTVGGGVAVLAVLFVAAVVILRALRSRSRRRAAPPRRVLGAWAEILDALLLAGAPPPAHLAAVEVAEHAARVAGAGARHARPRPAAPPLDELAVAVNAVGFAGTAAARPDEPAAQRAWLRAAEYGRALRARRSWWRRILWRIDPRPLRRRVPPRSAHVNPPP